ncbi:MAG: hypothetical protein LKJ90_02535 [Faecalibacterium sp.]|nr:hypothetical protein [Faecalibacterium sp.]
MKQEDLTGATIDRFCYDTPTCPQQDFYALCEDDRPLMLVFLPNYGHPISRVYLSRYADTLGSLRSGRLACVVHSDPQVIAHSLNGEYPFTLICDAGGVLYDYFNVESTTSRFSWSIEAAKIFHAAEKQGFQLEKNAPQQLPLTLAVGRGGQVLFSHYGQSLTDMPDDCSAIERVCAGLMKNICLAEEDDAAQEPPEETEIEAEPEEMCFAEDAPEQAEPEAEPETEQTSAEAAAPVDVVLPDTAQTPAHTDTPESPANWDKLIGLFAEQNR